MQRLLARSAAHAINVQRSGGAYNASRAILASSCRHFTVTTSVNKKLSKNMDATFFGEDMNELLESGKLSTEALSKPSTPTPRRNPPEKAAIPVPPVLPASPSASGLHWNIPSAPRNFNPQELFTSWSLNSIQPALSSHAIPLFDYMVNLVESPPSAETLARLDEHNALEFKKRWVCYEIDQENAKAHLPLIDFFLHHGLVFLPPTNGSMRPSEKIQTIDTTQVEKSLGPMEKISSSIIEDWKQEAEENKLSFPNLMEPDALMDPRDVLELPPTTKTPFHNRVVVHNHRSIFHDYAEGAEDDLLEEDELVDNEAEDDNDMAQFLPVSSRYYANLYHSTLMRRGVVQQTGKGKIRRITFMVLVGDGNGLVGYGEGKHSNSATALKAARLAAVRNMDWVERFEKRTIWTEMSTKLGSTHLILRPRPVGFGLRCNPHLHRILRAAGLKDISAKVWGSRNKLNVIKAAFRLLQAGHAPTSMGDGLGGKGKKLSKGGGLKSKSDLERARGRKLINLRY
ncbi:hypothetical protein CPB83DRAFT_813635 [Crepidotus variabilis]|uniref:Small ribosomal subunit protein uS5m n=1 Tax=Crepidotus variabilis TaxID=179855 RepID=A0A9P6JQL5_9AGAR|nr:hypothetical protein CPB83DRAFT_813635 [Crepidotus variabilis]